jgi:hypothetical protein
MGKSIQGAFLGIVMFLAAFPLLWWNEGRAVQTAKSLEEGAAAVKSVPSDKVDPAFDQKLVHTSGKADTTETLSDSTFGISVKAIHLRRVVEMYQWKEEKRDEGKSVTYRNVWSDDLIDSSGFQEAATHANPKQMRYQDQSSSASNVTLGAFKLSRGLVDKMDRFQPLAVDPQKIPEPLKAELKVHDGMFYLGASPATPQVGDHRILFRVVMPGEVSLVAQQTGETFQPFQTQAGDKIELLETGVHGAQAMFQTAIQRNVILTWALRALGFFLMVFGIAGVLSPITRITHVVPILGDVVGAGVILVAGLISLALSLVTIAVAWLAYRPVLGGILLAAGIGAFVLMKVLARKRAPA